MRSRYGSVFAAMLLLAAVVPANGQAPLEPPDGVVLSEARSIVQRMIANPRGPYSRIVWYCNDGTVQPPVAFACSERGGGRQHAEYSADRLRLATLGWSVGTIYAAMDLAELSDDATRRRRLRELPFERYLNDVDDGWVLRQARNYRGSTQAEDEEASGRSLLLGLLEDNSWTAENFLLLREAARVVPHGGTADDLARDVRRKAIDIVNIDRAFEPLRAEIHGSPSAATSSRVRAWARIHRDDAAALAAELAEQLNVLYGTEGRRDRLARHRERLAGQSRTRDLARALVLDYAEPATTRLESLAAVARDARELVVNRATPPATRLSVLDLINDLEGELALTAGEVLASATLSRAELIRVAEQLTQASYGTGLLTEAEFDLTDRKLDRAAGSDSLALPDYADLIETLKRLPQWATGSMRHTFAEPLLRYAALEPRAANYIDDVLRGSALVGMAEIARRLALDLGDLTGVAQLINGRQGLSAFGLNAGIARGELKLFADAEALATGDYDATDIVVLPETTAELAPVAGIITMGEGNPLSHVQLLARNFGIPNIAISPAVLSVVRPLEGREVLAAVASDGSLALLPLSDVPAEIETLLQPAADRRASLVVPPPDLTVTEPIHLRDLESALSGRVVGPKAANLGQLARLFPGRVAPALAIPFGIYANQIGGSGTSPRARLVAAYANHASGLIDDPTLAAELATVRGEIAGLEIGPALRDQLQSHMREEFGAPGTYGVFVRSDTNVEDLPEFTGAGLSETLPNVTGTDAVFASIPRVWSSVLSPRAIAWRSNLLSNPESIFASVLLMQSVPSEKSGVMVTTNLVGADAGVTVSAAWGVGGGVGGEATETLVLHPDGTETYVSGAKSPYQREINPAGGVSWVPAAEGAVLTPADRRALRELADEVLARYQPVFDENGVQRPWDIEYGFVDAELTLFQIRPLVERGQRLADRVVRALVPAAATEPPEFVFLNDAPSGFIE